MVSCLAGEPVVQFRVAVDEGNLAGGFGLGVLGEDVTDLREGGFHLLGLRLQCRELRLKRDVLLLQRDDPFVLFGLVRRERFDDGLLHVEFRRGRDFGDLGPIQKLIHVH